MTNGELAELFLELADIMEIAGENRFKILAYRRAASSIRRLDKSVEELTREEIIAIPGIGKAIAEKIGTALETGTFPTLEKWRQSGYVSLKPLLSLPQMNMRKLRAIVKDLAVESIDDLKHTISDGRLAASNLIDEQTKRTIAEYLAGAR